VVNQIDIAPLVRLFLLRELDSVRASIEAYPDDKSVWRPVPGITNVGGTLGLHIAGNLRHFIGAALGDTGYVRDRDAEFSARDLPRSDLIDRIEAARAESDRTLTNLPVADFEGRYPMPIAGRVVRTGDFLVHLAIHLAYHLGQLDYHRRIVTGEGAKVVPALQVSMLPMGGE